MSHRNHGRAPSLSCYDDPQFRSLDLKPETFDRSDLPPWTGKTCPATHLWMSLSTAVLPIDATLGNVSLRSSTAPEENFYQAALSASSPDHEQLVGIWKKPLLN